MQGVLVFCAGNALQCHSHWILARLRAKITGKRGDHLQSTAEGYALPEGGAFALVSCPHYLGEIVIYLGLALILGAGNLCIWIVLAWVVSSALHASLSMCNIYAHYRLANHQLQSRASPFSSQRRC